MIIWLIGISGAGKTTIGRELVQRLRDQGRATQFLDGDELRAVWQDDLGHEIMDRRKNHTRISKLCALLDQDDGLDVVVAALSIFPDLRRWNRENFRQYFEVFLDVPVDVARQRDTRGVYSSARRGGAGNVVGVDIPFPATDADLRIAAPEILGQPTDIAQSIFDRVEAVRK